ncbi:MAG: signal peptidase I [Thermoguttaceae bacterium]
MSSKKKPSSFVPSSPRAGKPETLRVDKSPGAAEPSFFSASGIREVVESIIIAFVLAFLFRTFEAEAFVIPTGSMAPTLLGRHKDVTCDQCGYLFKVSASDEVNQQSNEASGIEVIAATCPLCRHTMYVGPENPTGKDYDSYKGDRILVGKFPYQFDDPKRWDVVVFKYPLSAQTNFIKRAVGLPGETLRITHGDIFVKGSGDSQFTIARKSPAKIRAMLQTVHDADYVLPQIAKGTWPTRWTTATEGKAGWTTDDQRRYRTDGLAEGEVWLRYQHRVPSYENWQAYLANPNAPVNMKPQLISDFTAYNTDTTVSRLYSRSPWADQYYAAKTDAGTVSTGLPPLHSQLGLHWVGDLAVEASVKVESPTGEVILDLVKGGQHFLARIDVASGKATLLIPGQDEFHPTATTKVQGPGTYRLMLANVDEQLVLWVNGSVVQFDGPGIVSDGMGAVAYGLHESTWRPQPDDLAPVGIGSRQAKLEVEHLKVFRDIYYIAERYQVTAVGNPLTDFDPWNTPYHLSNDPRDYRNRQEVANVLSDPTRWDPFGKSRHVEFTLEPDQFFMLGDNSAESKDSRLWENGEFYVKRELLIGKALVIYWPHSLDSIPGTSIPFPFFPNFWRMGLVR